MDALFNSVLDEYRKNFNCGIIPHEDKLRLAFYSVFGAVGAIETPHGSADNTFRLEDEYPPAEDAEQSNSLTYFLRRGDDGSAPGQNAASAKGD